MKKIIKILLSIFLVLVIFLSVNYIFFTETGELRVNINSENVSHHQGKYYLDIDNYKNLDLPIKYYEKIDMDTSEDYKVSFQYNSLFKRGSVDYLERYGDNFKN